MEIPILQDVVLVLGLSLLIILFFQRIKVPALLGFLLVGVLVGPNGLNLISSEHEVELLSEIGIIFLLFIIGIEFSLKNLAAAKNRILGGGSLQVFLTTGITLVLALAFGYDWNVGVFLGFLFALSSTAIVLKILEDRNLVSSPHGKFAISILIYQDIIVVLMMLVTPILAGQAESPLYDLGLLLVKVLAFVVVIFLLAKYIVPKMLELVVQTKNRELFILTVTAFCLGVAFLTNLVGLSLALGAFFAGLIISESDYSHQATANVLPFREVFISFFFISVGGLLNLEFFLSHVLIILGLVVAVMLVKFLVVVGTVRLFRYPPRVALLSGLALFQVGEFSLLLSKVGLDIELIPLDLYQYFLAVAIITMGITPFVLERANDIAAYALQFLGRPKAKSAEDELEEEKDVGCTDHLVIIGYGINGDNIAYTAKKAGIPYVITELDPNTFRRAQKKHERVIFGDASNPVILKKACAGQARVLVIAISDTEAIRRILSAVRIISKTVYIIVRTRYVRNIEDHLKLGADVVIPEEFETSIEIFTRVLKKYMVPNEEIRSFITDVRSSDYLMLTEKDALHSHSANLSVAIPDQEIATVKVSDDMAHYLKGKTLAELDFRGRYRITVLAIKRGEQHITENLQSAEIKSGDFLYLFGKADDMYRFNQHF